VGLAYWRERERGRRGQRCRLVEGKRAERVGPRWGKEGGEREEERVGLAGPRGRKERGGKREEEERLGRPKEGRKGKKKKKVI
jgi:hypothetical protein